MSFPWNDVLSTGSAAISAIAACASWKAAARANQTAEAVARIEHARWHADLTPDFDLAFQDVQGEDALLNVHLNGPDELGHLDEVIVSIGDDDMDHTIIPRLGGPTQADIDAFVWGPWRFQPRVDEADTHGRAVAPVALKVGRGRRFSVERTRPGSWMNGTTPEQWKQKYAGHPIRLILTCRRDDMRWVIARQVDNPTAPSIRSL